MLRQLLPMLTYTLCLLWVLIHSNKHSDPMRASTSALWTVDTMLGTSLLVNKCETP